MTMDLAFEILRQVTGFMLAAVGLWIVKSLQDLTTKIAVVIERIDSHERRIGNLEIRRMK